ncbi:hypothetical protein CROQUDRAFT_716792 [Cronartium quercuum f. sp. fusiforme G11]|uniref:Uncharacterized protein n=1 Tax=Cronartium quercuum f. sp. fusiforme G11 TaxID=708437 RepID=A0A9P6NEL3_9BASI|nr:hypothetical protein CROQUDRAFT_716792 [Cronartium quercuum f. sp. fusiforme G11]
METNDNSFIKQSLSDTLLKNESAQRVTTSSSLSRPRRMLNLRELSSRKAKADEDTGGILKSLGLTPTSRKVSNQSMIDNDDGTDWEQVGSDRESEEASGSKGIFATPKANPLPSGPGDFLNHASPGTKFIPGANNHSTRHGSMKSLDGETLSSLRKKLADSEKAKDDLVTKCKRLERELTEVKEQKLRPDGKTLGAREYEELEKQFDAQEKLLSGYQRENERSLIELEAVKAKSLKMSNFLNKVYGPDWEDTIGLNDGSPNGTLHQNHLHSLNNTPTALPATPAEKFATQLAQVQLLVQGMERRLVSREVELESLHQQAKEDSKVLRSKISKIDPTSNLMT